MQPMEVNYECTLFIHEVRHDSSSFTFRPEGASDGSTKDLVYVHIGFFNEFPIGFINMCFSFPKKIMKYWISKEKVFPWNWTVLKTLPGFSVPQ